MRGMRGVGNGGAKRERKLPERGRNVEGATYRVAHQGSEQGIRCKACGAFVPVAAWWKHGTAEDPHQSEPAGS